MLLRPTLALTPSVDPLLFHLEVGVGVAVVLIQIPTVIPITLTMDHPRKRKRKPTTPPALIFVLKK